MSSQPRIGIVLPQPPSYSETFFSSKIRGLEKRGAFVTVFAPRGERADQGFDLKSPWPVHLPFRLIGLAVLLACVWSFLRSPLRSAKLVTLLGKEGERAMGILKNLYLNQHILHMDLDWLHFGFATMGASHELVAKAMGCRSAVSFRGYDIGIYPLVHEGCYERLFRHIDKVHSISDDLYHKALSLGLGSGVPWRKITPAIRTEDFVAREEGGDVNREMMKILTVGRLHWKKGYEDMLMALRGLKGQGVKFTYTIVGTGPGEERIRYAVYQLGLKDQVVFRGKLSHEETAGVYRENDFYLQYSVQEGFCNSVLEAQASGLVCVVSDAEGLSENVLDEQTGFVVPRHDWRGLEKKLLQVVNLSDARLRDIRKAASERVDREFRVEDQVEAFWRFYTEE